MSAWAWIGIIGIALIAGAYGLDYLCDWFIADPEADEAEEAEMPEYFRDKDKS